MRPSGAINNPSYNFTTNPKLSGDFGGAQFGCCVDVTDLKNILLSQFVVGRQIASHITKPSFFRTVASIIFSRPQEQVKWVDAGRIIAGMTNKHFTRIAGIIQQTFWRAASILSQMEAI